MSHQTTTLNADIEQSIRDKKNHLRKIVREPGKAFFFWRAVVSFFLPDGDGHDSQSKLPYIAHAAGYFALLLLTVIMGTYHLCAWMMPLFDRLGLTVANHPVIHQIAGVVLIFTLVICPSIMICIKIFRTRDYFVEKLEVALTAKGHQEFDYRLHRLALIVNKCVFEKLLFQALKHKELESYQILLEFNRHYLFIDLDNLPVRESRRQCLQVESCYDNIPFFVDRLDHKRWLEHLAQNTAGSNRYVYDLFKLCLRENSQRKLGQDVQKKALDYQLAMAFFQYFMTIHHLDTNALVEQMFSECEQMNDYLPLLSRYRLKNKLDNDLLDQNIQTDNESDMEENLSVVKI